MGSGSEPEKRGTNVGRPSVIDEAALIRSRELLEHATEFRYEPDLVGRVQVGDSGVDLAVLQRKHALYVAEGRPTRWGIRLATSPYWWSTAAGDWVTAFYNLGNRDQALYLVTAVLERHRRRVVEVAQREVEDARRRGA